MGCVLGKHDHTEKKERAIYYLSKKFIDCEASYSLIEKLCCALVWATRRLKQYILYYTTWMISKLDHLKYLMDVPALSKRLACWQILFSEFNIQYVIHKVVKRSAIADFITSRTSGEYEPLSFDFSNEDLIAISVEEMSTSSNGHWKLNFGGASNTLEYEIGVILVSHNGEHYPFTSQLNLDCTNNMDEYESFVFGIKASIECEVKILKVYGDSALVIYQLSRKKGKQNIPNWWNIINWSWSLSKNLKM
ncbi:uncharacterized protein LOC120207427 [Hibiscus syriacus]|uniref:uncharacterized protein LOC120207427 n=1 Tax=Hibiscus syriacus TaxID=106335 RepID=UPI001922961C|nr:uncharacterized protein LOC120207427 [Hibiscus syriacus]